MTYFSNVFLHVKTSFFIMAKFIVKWFCNSYLLNKISTIREMTFIIAAFQQVLKCACTC